MHISIIILAAGSSSRMGTSKQLLDIGGKTLLRSTVEVSLESKANDVTVVFGSNAETHAKALAGINIAAVLNNGWSGGMGSSIKSGLASVIKASSPEGVIIVVCDQPFLTSSHLNKLIDTYQSSERSIIASAYAGSFGVPVLVAKKYFEALLKIEDAYGAKHIIQDRISDAEIVDFPEGATDLDTPEDYNAFLSRS